MKSADFWNVISYSLIAVDSWFGGKYCLHLHGRGVNEAVSQEETVS
jgi:hypothetical protein